MPKIKPSKIAERQAARAVASVASEIDPDDYTRAQLLEMVRSRAAYSHARSMALSGMTKEQLVLLLNASSSPPAASTASSFSSSSSSSSPPLSTKTLCESDLPGTTRELRRLASQRGVANSSTLTKQQLCAALAEASADIEMLPVKDEEMELPAGFLDLVTQEVMRNPIVASDGYSYGRTSLRNLFMVEARRFVEQGRPASRPLRVLSLKNSSIELKNPFPGIPDWPASFPLIQNHDLRLAIDEWLLEHGLPNQQDVGEEKDGEEEKESEPVYSRRDGDGFQNGIFFGAPEPESEPESEPEQLDSDEIEHRELTKRFDFEFGDAVRTKKLNKLREKVFPSVFGVDDGERFRTLIRSLLILMEANDFRMQFGAIGEIESQVSAVDPAVQFNTLLRLTQIALFNARAQDRASISSSDVRPDVENHVDVRYRSLASMQVVLFERMYGLPISFESIASSRRSRVDRVLVDAFAKLVPTSQPLIPFLMGLSQQASSVLKEARFPSENDRLYVVRDAVARAAADDRSVITSADVQRAIDDLHV